MQYRHKKHFGQHFLKDPSQAGRIADTLEGWGTQYPFLLEIGPGAGILTQFLAKKADSAHQLKLIEVDADLLPSLEASYANDFVEVVHQDFLKYPLQTIDHDFGVIGNFPYNISSQILFKLLDYREQIPEMAGMFQKEVAMRVASMHGNKVYGILSVLIQTYYEVDICFHLKPGHFQPPPKVDSTVIHLRRKAKVDQNIPYEFLKGFVKTAFNQRRKTLRNSLSAYLARAGTFAPDDSILQRRPESLSVGEFQELAKAFYINGVH